MDQKQKRNKRASWGRRLIESALVMAAGALLTGAALRHPAGTRLILSLGQRQELSDLHRPLLRLALLNPDKAWLSGEMARTLDLNIQHLAQHPISSESSPAEVDEFITLESYCHLTIKAMGELGQAAVPTLLSIANDARQDSLIRWVAIEALGEADSKGVSTTSLIALLDSEEPSHPIWLPAVDALVRVAPFDPRTRPTLERYRVPESFEKNSLGSFCGATPRELQKGCVDRALSRLADHERSRAAR